MVAAVGSSGWRMCRLGVKVSNFLTFSQELPAFGHHAVWLGVQVLHWRTCVHSGARRPLTVIMEEAGPQPGVSAICKLREVRQQN